MDALDRYLEELKVVLGPLGETQADEICAEIRAHILDTVDQGEKSLDEVLQALGSPDELGRNYLGELGADNSGSQRAQDSQNDPGSDGGATDTGKPKDGEDQDFFGGFREKMDARVFSAMAREAAKAAEEAMKAMGDIDFDALGKTDFDDPEQRWKLGAFGHLGDLGTQDFGDRMEEFGDKMDRFGESMGRWGEEFGKKMEKVGEALGKSMGAMGEEMGRRMSGWSGQQDDDGAFAGTTMALDFDSRSSMKVLVPGATVFLKPGAEGDDRLRLELVVQGLAVGEVSIEPVEHEGVWVLDLAGLLRPGLWLKRLVIHLPVLVRDFCLECRGGNVLAHGLTLDTLNLRTWGGNLGVEKTRGNLDLESCGGNIDCGQPWGRVSMKTDAGNLQVRGCAGLCGGYLETLAGNIAVEGTGSLEKCIEFDLGTQAGRVEVQGRDSGTAWKGLLGPEITGNSPERLAAHTLAGNIQVD